MRNKIAPTFGIGLAFIAARALAAAPAPEPWTLLTERDLQAIHETLATNHPGTVDPQSDRYRRWLDDGLQEARADAVKVRSYSDYERTLLRYLNGFRDGHLGPIFMLSPERLSWPGFLVRRDTDGAVRVLAVAEDSNVPLRAELTACDGKSLDQLMKERLDPYYWNADIPHARWNRLPRLFQLSPDDIAKRMSKCTFNIDGASRTFDLSWRSVSRDTLTRHVQAMRTPIPELGLQNRQGIWFVSLPSFGYFGPTAAGINALISEMNARASELRAATVVFDVRGNGGGNSAWGERVAAALWGEAGMAHVRDSFDWTVDWRVSAKNIEHLNSVVERTEQDGLTEAAESWRKARDAVVEAMKQGRSLVRVEELPKTAKNSSPPKSLVTGRIFLLTDGACASACLDFADLVRRLPNVTHIGLPTSADAVYIDNTQVPLPSGLAQLSYSLKVYRNRVRANNEWYEPAVHWPGGVMSDDAITAWITQLARAPAVRETTR